MLIKYKGWYDYFLSCQCTIHELIRARGDTTICPSHEYRVFIIEAVPKERNDG